MTKEKFLNKIEKFQFGEDTLSMLRKVGYDIESIEEYRGALIESAERYINVGTDDIEKLIESLREETARREEEEEKEQEKEEEKKIIIIIDVIEDALFEGEKNRVANLLSSNMPLKLSDKEEMYLSLASIGKLKRFMLINKEPIGFDELNDKQAKDINDSASISFLLFVLDVQNGN